MESKTCSRCKENLPINNFIKSHAKCKQCFAEHRKTHVSHNKRYRRITYERTTEPQKCKICNQIKDASEYARARENINGVNTCCKSCAYKLQKEHRSKNVENFMKNLYIEARSNSKKRIKQKEFTISFDEWMSIYNKQDGKCALTGVNMTYTYNDKERDKKVMNRNNISPDRIDSDKGYTKDNVQFVCVEINIAKQEHTNTEFIEMCRQVANFNTPT